jgi:hypothetical protein
MPRQQRKSYVSLFTRRSSSERGARRGSSIRVVQQPREETMRVGVTKRMPKAQTRKRWKERRRG